MDKIKLLFKTESGVDAFRNILIIIVPSIFLFYIINPEFAIAFSVGALLASLTDLPGNRQDKVRTVKWSLPVFAITAFLTSWYLSLDSGVVILLLGIFGFVYTLLSLFGFRISVIGNLGLVVASFTIGLRPEDPLLFTVALLCGSVTSFVVSLVQVYLFPYRSLGYAIDEGIENMANLLRLKIDCYDENSPLCKSYKDLSVLHVKVSDQLETVRSLLLREKELVNSENQVTQVWLSKVYHLVDLYELLMALDTDYETVRKVLKDTNTLPLIRIALYILADETQKLRLSRGKSNIPLQKREELEAIIQQLRFTEECNSGETKSLIQSVCTHLEQISNTLNLIKSDEILPEKSWVESKNYADFAPPKSSLSTVLKNMNFKSPIFMYSIRMSLLLVFGGLIGYWLPEFRYASWIILTIILVAKPSYNITQKRNYQRITGSIIGLLLSVPLLYSIDDPIVLLVISAFSLYLFLLFNKPNYQVSVIFITVCIVLSQKMYSGDTASILSSRFIFTLMGAVLAVLGTLAIPINHYRAIEKTTASLIQNFKNYLEKIRENLQTEEVNFYDLRLLRKFTQTSLAQSYDSLEQLSKEPIVGKQFTTEINHLQSLAYRINALLVGLSINITRLNAQEELSLLKERISNITQLIDDSETISKKIARREKR